MNKCPIALSMVAVLCLGKMAAAQAPHCYWQQAIDYKMSIDMNVANNTFAGTQLIRYTNNSPDTLRHLYFHLYWNAFKPGSLMDEGSRRHGRDSINGRPDWDGRVADRIAKLLPTEQGDMTLQRVYVHDRLQKTVIRFDGTILEVQLDEPVLPHSSIFVNTKFQARVPLQIRRSGRDNPNTGVQYSMSQWYPKICAYDRDGWQPTPYVAREFYGVWGNYDVTIKLDKRYKLGGTGVLQNAEDIGWGYDLPGTPLKSIPANARTWHFKAENVHDFVWAADTAYNHLVRTAANGTKLHTIYKYKPADAAYEAGWQLLADVAPQVLPFMEKTFGKYLYPQYSFIHGGDGGMEYPMATLIQSSGLGTVFHEWMHSWYQMMLATNEGKYPWMDEGFTEYASTRVSDYYQRRIERKTLGDNPALLARYDSMLNRKPLMLYGEYQSYFALVKMGLEEPLTTHADHYETNRAYGTSVYSKGAIFLNQLGYIVGDSLCDRILLAYYDQWKLKHPHPGDFMRVAEQQSGMELDWYYEYWIATTKHIDYAIDSVFAQGGAQRVVLRRIGAMPMPLNITVTDTKGRKTRYYIPLDLTLKSASVDNGVQVAPTWQYTNPTYILTLKNRPGQVHSIEADESQRMADIDRSNNVWTVR
ncbi:MAG: M1 family metallopeptidase [Edaphocola sp.]